MVNKKIKVIGIIVAIIFTICVLYNIFIWFVVYTFPIPEMMTYQDDGQYYKTIKSTIKNQSELNLGDIFTFDWENVYFVSDTGFSGEELAKRIGVNCDLEPIDEHSPSLRLVFFNNDKVVYDYMYDTNYLRFEPLDNIVSKESTVFVVSKRGKPIILKVKQESAKLLEFK